MSYQQMMETLKVKEGALSLYELFHHVIMKYRDTQIFYNFQN